jgi:hypothetical protein
MSMFKTRRAGDQRQAEARRPVVDTHDKDIEGVDLERFALFIARVGEPDVTREQHESIARALGFPAGRFDLIRNAWLIRIYSSPALGKEFGTALDAARSQVLRA